jgi:hypothetical protein
MRLLLRLSKDSTIYRFSSLDKYSFSHLVSKVNFILRLIPLMISDRVMKDICLFLNRTYAKKTLKLSFLRVLCASAVAFGKPLRVYVIP